MQTEFIQLSEQDGVTSLTLNRPDKRNAMHGPMVIEMTKALQRVVELPTRVLIIKGAGDHFCAGGDIAWMQQIAVGNETQNYNDAQSLADLLFNLYHLPVPTIVLAHGAALGGGMGLLSAADIAIATTDTTFGLPEVKIGLTPSMISPYVIAAMGERRAHYYFLTGERFKSDEAFRLGLIHKVVDKDRLLEEGMILAHSLMSCGPIALRTAKQLIRRVAKQSIDAELSQYTAEHLAELRMTEEAQEGLSAFIEKRRPAWDL